MAGNVRTRIRDLLPRRYQVPAKYWYCWFRGSLEDEMRLLPLIVRKRDRVVDIGGNRGIYAYRLSKLGAQVEVFEPNPICFDVLSSWATAKPDINLHSVALSDGKGSANLHIPVDESGVEHDASASIENMAFAHARDQLVPLQTLDSYGFEDVTLIKIDVEGHEYAVIEGAASTLTSSKPALLVEVEQRHNCRPVGEMFQKIIAFGYQGYFIEDDKLADLKNFDVKIHQSMENFGGPKKPYINNFLFLHQDKLADEEYSRLMANF